MHPGCSSIPSCKEGTLSVLSTTGFAGSEAGCSNEAFVTVVDRSADGGDDPKESFRFGGSGGNDLVDVKEECVEECVSFWSFVNCIK